MKSLELDDVWGKCFFFAYHEMVEYFKIYSSFQAKTNIYYKFHSSFIFRYYYVTLTLVYNIRLKFCKSCATPQKNQLQIFQTFTKPIFQTIVRNILEPTFLSISMKIWYGCIRRGSGHGLYLKIKMFLTSCLHFYKCPNVFKEPKGEVHKMKPICLLPLVIWSSKDCVKIHRFKYVG